MLEPGEYKDKLPELHVVDMRCTMDMGPYNKMKQDFVLELGQTITAPTAAVVTQKLQQLAGGFVYGADGAEWLTSHKYDLLKEVLEENQHDNRAIAVVIDSGRHEQRVVLIALHCDDINWYDHWMVGLGV